MVDLDQLLSSPRVIPVLVIDEVENSVPLAQALIDGGLSILEVTLRTPAAIESIRRMKTAFPDAIVGAGTVLDARSIEMAEDAGADFLVSPGASLGLLDAAAAGRLPLIPGIATTSEAMTALAKGFTTQKLYPAKLSGGPNYLKSIAAVLPEIRFMPTGGIGPLDAPDYLLLPNVAAVGGTWIAPQALVAAKRWGAIRGLAEEALSLVKDLPC